MPRSEHRGEEAIEERNTDVQEEWGSAQLMLGEEQWAGERAGPGGFWRRLLGGGGLAAGLESWMGLPQLGWSACPNLDQENWPCRNRALSATAQSSMLANLKIPPSLFVFFPLALLLFFSPSFLFSSFSDDPFWQPWDSLAHPPTALPGNPKPPLLWATPAGPKPCRTPCCSGTGWQQLQRPPTPLDSVLSNAN